MICDLMINYFIFQTQSGKVFSKRSILCCDNFPILYLAMYWKRLTSQGALIGGGTGLFIATILVILGPAVWVDIFGNEKAIFPYKYPALFSVTTAFIFTWFFSKIDKSKKSQKEINKFDNQLLRSQIGMK